jgi:hypothetical protein
VVVGAHTRRFCSVMVVMAAFPIPQIRDIVFRWAMFLAAYNGRGIFTFWYSFQYIIAHSPLRILPPMPQRGWSLTK